MYQKLLLLNNTVYMTVERQPKRKYHQWRFFLNVFVISARLLKMLSSTCYAAVEPNLTNKQSVVMTTINDRLLS